MFACEVDLRSFTVRICYKKKYKKEEEEKTDCNYPEGLRRGKYEFLAHMLMHIIQHGAKNAPKIGRQKPSASIRIKRTIQEGGGRVGIRGVGCVCMGGGRGGYE